MKFDFVSSADFCSKIAAFAKWQCPRILTTEQRAAKAVEKKKASEENPLPAGTNVELHDAFFGGLNERQERFYDDSKDYCQFIYRHT